MRRRRLIGERIISDRIPKDPRIEPQSVSIFGSCLKNFVEGYLKGAATIDIGRVDTGYACVCTYFASYALRLAVEHLAVDAPIHITYSAMDGYLRLRIDYTDEPEDGVLTMIERAASDAGFELVSDSGVIALMTKLHYTTELSLYAKTPPIILTDLYNVFFC